MKGSSKRTEFLLLFSSVGHAMIGAMEKTCEFCTALRPVVYCKADAAYLCLPCDAKVHSANALSHRHLRTLLCDLCRHRPAYARCWDHRMFLCRGCDQTVHGVSIQHQKRAVSSYMGSPSAKDFAALWGFELNELSQVASLEPCGPCESPFQIGNSSITSKVSSSALVSGAQCEAGSSIQQTQISYKGQQVQDNCFILKQILDLKRLQLTKVNKVLPATSGEEQADISSSACSSLKESDNSLARSLHYQDFGSDLHQSASQLQELKVDSLPLPFSQADHFPSSSSTASSLLGESFWQCKSPANSSQLWSQNMQDLGVCEDIACNVDVPEVDITFCNFEELFGNQDPIRVPLDNEHDSCFSVAKDMSIDNSDNRNAGAREDASVTSSVDISQSAHKDKDDSPFNQVSNYLGSPSSPSKIQPSYSTMSFSISRLSAESCGTEYLDFGFSRNVAGGEVSCQSTDLDGVHSKARENAIMRYKDKKKAQLQDKRNHYAPRKSRSNVRKRVKEDYPKAGGYDSETVDVTRSY